MPFAVMCNCIWYSLYNKEFRNHGVLKPLSVISYCMLSTLFCLFCKVHTEVGLLRLLFILVAALNKGLENLTRAAAARLGSLFIFSAALPR